MTQYVWHAIRFDFFIYIFWHTLTHSRSCSSPFLKAFTDTVLWTLYFYTHTPKNNLLVAWTWRFLLSQYECIYNKSTNFSHFSFDDHRALSRQTCDHLSEWEWVSDCVWHNDSARPHPNKIHKNTYHRGKEYTFTYGHCTRLKRSPHRPKTSKPINFETKVEHARKINIKNSSSKHPVTPIFLFIMYETNILVKLLLLFFAVIAGWLDGCLCSYGVHKMVGNVLLTFVCTFSVTHSLTLLFLFFCCFCFFFVVCELSVAITVAHLLSLFVSQTKTAEHKSRKYHYIPHHWRGAHWQEWQAGVVKENHKANKNVEQN